MRLPNKVTAYQSSVLSKLVPILEKINVDKYSVYELYKELINSFEDISEYIDALDCLFILGRIDYVYEKEVLFICYKK